MLKDALQKTQLNPTILFEKLVFYEKVSSFEPTFKECQQWISLLIMRTLTHRWLAGEGWWKNCWILDLFFFGSAGVRSRLKMSKTDLPQTRICNYKYVVAGYVSRKSLAISKKELFASLGMIFEIWFPSFTVGPIAPPFSPSSSRMISEKAAPQATRALRFSPLVCKNDSPLQVGNHFLVAGMKEALKTTWEKWKQFAGLNSTAINTGGFSQNCLIWTLLNGWIMLNPWTLFFCWLSQTHTQLFDPGLIICVDQKTASCRKASSSASSASSSYHLIIIVVIKQNVHPNHTTVLLLLFVELTMNSSVATSFCCLVFNLRFRNQTWWSQNMEGQHCDLAWKNRTRCETCCETAFFVDFIETQIKTCLHLLNTKC